MQLTISIVGCKIYKYLHSLYNNGTIIYTVLLLLLFNYVNTDNSTDTTDNPYRERMIPTSSLLLNNNNQSINKKSDDCSISLTEFIIYFYIQPIICFIGFILNILNVIIFCRPQFSGAAYVYMIAMSLADAITLISYMPSGLVR
ncbi:G coupled receptor-like protein [Schistosoma japonicum]|uniref:G coupled receptor-like protein n=1 Tax=Schistosoma japonicum TaxID=6182 RepID=A0A4Z2CT43_SCHJA|nr:G coupled receptor-like protein [Schistosoma japonicum]